MTTITDDFSASMATNWTTAHGGGMSSSGGQAVNSSSGSYDGVHHNTAMATGDHRASAILASAPAAAVYRDVKFRHNGSSGASRNGWQVSVGGTNEYYISEVTGGAGTDRVSGTTSLSSGQRLMGEGEGTTIRLKLDGTTINSYTSSLYQSQTRVGMAVYRGASAAPMTLFEAEDLGVGGGGVPLLLRSMLMCN
jgi:hypothetical protein